MRFYATLRKTIGWTAIAAFAVLVVLWAVSLLWYVHYQFADRAEGLLRGGQAYYSRPVSTAVWAVNPGWNVEFIPASPEWYFEYKSQRSGRLSVYVPLWPIVLLTLAIAVAAWSPEILAYRRRRTMLPRHLRTHPRIRKVTKWGGALVIGVLAAMWGGSLIWHVRWEPPRQSHAAELWAGQVHFIRYGARFGGMPGPGWGAYSRATPPKWKVEIETEMGGTFVTIPLWLPAILVLSVTIPAWWLDAVARRRSGLCVKCGYSLVGLPAGSTCPECGKPGAGSTS